MRLYFDFWVPLYDNVTVVVCGPQNRGVWEKVDVRKPEYTLVGPKFYL
jgi:hypothetical protein